MASSVSVNTVENMFSRIFEGDIGEFSGAYWNALCPIVGLNQEGVLLPPRAHMTLVSNLVCGKGCVSKGESYFGV